MELKEGMVFIYHTCKSIDPMTGQRINKYDTYWLVNKVNEDFVRLYNLKDGRYIKFSICDMKDLIKKGDMELSK